MGNQLPEEAALIELPGGAPGLTTCLIGRSGLGQWATCITDLADHNSQVDDQSFDPQLIMVIDA